MAYIGLYLAIRSGNWKLHLASIKLMAAVYLALPTEIQNYISFFSAMGKGPFPWYFIQMHIGNMQNLLLVGETKHQVHKPM